MKEEDSLDLASTAKVSFFQSGKNSSMGTPNPNFFSPGSNFTSPDYYTIKKLNDLSRITVDPWLASPKITIPPMEHFATPQKGPAEGQRIDEHEIHLDENGPTLRWCAYCARETKAETQMKSTPTTFWSSVAIFLMGGCLLYTSPSPRDS